MRIAILLVLGMLAVRADAYPHFQLSTGSSQCGQCHVAPTGGGVLTAWGQSEAGDTIARGGDGTFLHGAVELPEWLLVGGEVRLAALANETGDAAGVKLAAFPMQLDLIAGVARGAFTVVGSAGVRGRARSGASDDPSNPASEAMDTSLASYVISREHYVMWRSETGRYARAGRFAAPYGLRVADHTAYVRRYLGYNLLEETYGLGGGYVADAWEIHATAFVHDVLQGATRDDVGGALLVETIATDRVIVGGSARASIASTDTRLQAGMHGKVWLDDARLLVQAEVDGVRQLIDGVGDRWQLAAYAGPVLVPARGVYAGLAYQVFAEDLATRAVTRHSGDAWISLLPTAHVELMLSGRAQWIGPGQRALGAMLQVHYTL